MARATKSAEEIQALVHNYVHAIPEVCDDKAEVRVPKPYRHEPDAGGCNWNMEFFGNARGYERAIADVLTNVRAKVNLAD